MKKTIAFLLTVACLYVSAQTDTTRVDTLWKVEGFGGLTLNQVSFTNWAAGGENTISLSLGGFITAKYKKDRHSWDNVLNFTYGLLWTKQQGMRKNEDKLELESKYGYALSKDNKWSLSLLGNFKSQFAKGYNFPNDSVVISKFASPGYLTIALGIDWKPKDYFSLFISPVTGRVLFVRDQAIANSGMYGNDAAVYDSLGNLLTEGDNVRFDFGAYLSARFNKEVVKNVTIVSKVDVFANYTGKTAEARVPDVNWETAFLFKINEFLSASLTLNLIYDKEIMIPDKDDPTQLDDRVQFKEALGIGLAYKFKNKNVPDKK